MESFCYGELGLKPPEYYCLTMRQFDLMHQGYNRRMDLLKEQNLEAWRRERFGAYYAIKPHLKTQISIFDFLPLEGDPKQDEQMQRKEALEAIAEYTKRGLLKAIA